MSITASMNRFDRYLRHARRRESYRQVLVFLALLFVSLILVTALGAWTGLIRGFTPLLTNVARLTLIVVTVVCVLVLFMEAFESVSKR